MSLKNNILFKLENTGEYISGQQLARELGVSRGAVWKAVTSLKNEGYTIDSVNNKGYKLLSPADTLSADIIFENMKSRARKLQIVLLDRIDSTNNEAKRMLADGFCGDAVIIANEQTNGRGRLGRTFYSPKNTGIYMSFIIQTELPLSDAVTVTTAASVAAARAIEKVTGIIPGIKWVNDIYINGKKVCGILTEAVSDFETATARSVIIGIGVNISTTDFPDEIKSVAASLGTSNPIRNLLIAEIANELTNICLDLTDTSSFMDYYKSHSILIGREIDFYKNNIRYSGTAEDIDNKGGLVVKLNDGGVTTLSSGEVTVRLSDS